MNYMNYESFKTTMAEDITKKFSHENVKISFRHITKVNGNYEALTVIPADSNVGINLNVEKAFAAYEDVRNYAGILASAFNTISVGLSDVPEVDANVLLDYENIKRKLSIEVISAEKNAELLDKIPHDRIEDLAVVYRFVIESNEDYKTSTLITNGMIDHMGVSREQLRADALESAPKIRPAVIKGMNETIIELFGIPTDVGDDVGEMMFVASVPDKNAGAGVLAYPNFMDQATEKLGGDFFILPSSIHELILVPDHGEMDVETLKDMVREVNTTEVDPEDRLTDNVYHYDTKNHVFELAEKFAERRRY